IRLEPSNQISWDPCIYSKQLEDCVDLLSSCPHALAPSMEMCQPRLYLLRKSSRCSRCIHMESARYVSICWRESTFSTITSPLSTFVYSTLPVPEKLTMHRPISSGN